MAVFSKPGASRPLPEPRYQPLLIVLSAAAAGILADRCRPLPFRVWWMLALASLSLWLALPPAQWLWSALGKQLHRQRRKQPEEGDVAALAPGATASPTPPLRRMPLVAANVLVLLAIAATAAAWRHCCWNLFPTDDLSRYARQQSEPICFEAIAVEAPRTLPPKTPDLMRAMLPEDGTRLAVDLVSLRDGDTWRPIGGRATLLVLGEPPRLEAGDRIRCFGRLSAVEKPQNPGEFDRAAQLRSDRILSAVHAPTRKCLTVVQTGSEWNVWRQLGRLRKYGRETLARYLDPSRAELAAAVLLGFREDLDSTRNETFLTTGTVHILCISGLHVGILAGALFWLMRRTRIPRGWTAAAIAAIVLLYAMMVDVGPSVVRATILVLVACVAVWLGRRPISFNSLAAAALVVLAINPEHLFHTGAQLSFLCVAGLIWFASRRPHWDDEKAKRDQTLERLILQNLSWLSRNWRKLRRSVVGIAEAGLLMWVLTMPLVLARFHVLSLAGMVANTLLWPLMSVSLLSGFGVLVFGTIFPPLACVFGWLCDESFWLLEASVKLGHRLPCGHFWLPGPGDWWLWGFYGALGLTVALPRFRLPRRWCVALLAAWIAAGFAVSAWRHDRHRLDCTFLSVGHGSAVFVEFPAGKTMLYDAGRMGEPSRGARQISEFLWDRGLAHLDAVVLSHPDIDHYNALPELLDKFSVGAVYVSAVMFEKQNPAVRSLHSAIDHHGVPLREIKASDRLAADGDCLVEVLHPPRNWVCGSDNASSIVLAIEYCGRRILLPGDLESPGLDDMLAQQPRQCEVLMAPHHGSRKSNSPDLARWCRPRWVVFSDDGRWNTPAIDETYRAVGGCPLHTHKCGAVRAQIGADGIRVSQFLERR